MAKKVGVKSESPQEQNMKALSHIQREAAHKPENGILVCG